MNLGAVSSASCLCWQRAGDADLGKVGFFCPSGENVALSEDTSGCYKGEAMLLASSG